MKIIAKIGDLNRQGVKGYAKRRNTKTILLNKNGKVGMQYFSKSKRYTLPGGGIERGETILEGLRRECLEEVGVCKIKILKELGKIIEVRSDKKIIQTVYSYLTEVDSNIGKTNLTDDEKAGGCKMIWMEVEKARKEFQKILAKDKNNIAAKRNLIILEEALK